MKDIKGYEGLYAVTSCGKVWSYKRNKFLKPSKFNGYDVVYSYKDGKRKMLYVHRLVAESYIPNPNNYEFVNHKNDIYSENNINNLYWSPYLNRYDIKYLKKNLILCVETGVIYSSIMSIIRQYNCTLASICKALVNESETAYGYHWRYYND